MKKLLVIGASGMVASRFCELAGSHFHIIPVDEKILDITDKLSVNSYFSRNKFDAVINFAAYTNVDAAELEKGQENGLCYRLNTLGPQNISLAAGTKKIFMVQISTDFVFPGTSQNPGPYSEDAILPKNDQGIGWYGWTKNRAENFLTNNAKNYAIVRIGYPFRAAEYENKKDWARNLINLYKEQKLYPLFNDQIQSVIFIDDLVKPLSKIIDEEINATLHLVSADTTTPYEIGSYLLNKFAGKQIDIKEGSIKEFLATPGKTPRPVRGGLTAYRSQEILGMRFNTWKQMADEFLLQLSL